jgi:hypothetical protein
MYATGLFLFSFSLRVVSCCFTPELCVVSDPENNLSTKNIALLDLDDEIHIITL